MNNDYCWGAQTIAQHCKQHKYSKQYEGYWLSHPCCEICGGDSSAPHHIKTRGAGGTDESVNLLSLCMKHHVEIHQIGKITFAEKYELKGRGNDVLQMVDW